MDDEDARWVTFRELALARGTSHRAAVVLVSASNTGRPLGSEGPAGYAQSVAQLRASAMNLPPWPVFLAFLIVSLALCAAIVFGGRVIWHWLVS